ncbi:MAG TPA: hypothetical protein DDZ91_04260 [Firmicutes bacterium]|nr:hypothetical protein [Bacillota bacterium]
MGIKIGIINPNGLESSTQQALDCLVTAFSKQNIPVKLCLYTNQLPDADLLIGTYEKSRIVKDLVENSHLPLSLTPESLIIQEISIKDQTPLLACAYDTRGLNYALFELAERIDAQSLPALYKPTNEEPLLKLRGVVHFISIEEFKKGWTISRDYWKNYFEMLVRNRFNYFTLVFDSPYFTPIFPYLFYIPEHPGVNPFRFSDTLRAANLGTLQNFAELADQSGLDLHIGLWDFFTGSSTLPHKPFGLNNENIESYLYLALKQLIFSCSEIKGIDLKFYEEPIKQEFFLNTIIKAILETGNKTRLKLYANQIETEVITELLESGVKTILTNNGWDEKFGLPYLREETPSISLKDQQNSTSLCYQLSTSTILPWGDPDYVFRLIQSLKSSAYSGLELIPPVAHQTGKEVNESLNPALQYYRWGYERYWYYYHLFGRRSFNLKTAGEVLIRDFHRRFGEQGNGLADLYQLTGKVLPLYHTVHYNKEPNSELNTGGLLDYYLRVSVGDPTFFSGFQEFTHSLLAGTSIIKLSPLEIANCLEKLGTEILEKVISLQEYLPRGEENFVKEWQSILEDSSLFGNFSLYHSNKFRAALELSLFEQTKDLNSLHDTLHFLKTARRYWETIICIATRSYPQHSKNWSEKRLLLLEDEKRLSILWEEYQTRGVFLVGFDFGGSPDSNRTPDHNLSIFPDYYIERGFSPVDHLSIYNPDRGFGWINTAELHSVPAPLIRLSEQDLLPSAETGVNSPFPYENQLLNKLVWSRKPATFQVDLTPGSYLAHLTFCDRSLRRRRHGPMKITINNQVVADQLIITTGKRIDLREVVEIKDGKLTIDFACLPDQDWFISALSINPVAPTITHTPVTKWVREEPLVIRASVTGVNPIRQVILNYQTENERGYHMIIMAPLTSNLYSTTIPSAYLQQGKNINYYITALDSLGREASFGSFEHPFPMAVVNTENYSPSFFHLPPSKVQKEQDFKLKFSVRPLEEVEKVTLLYKSLGDQFNQVTMERESEEYVGNIPSSLLLPDCLIKYRFIVMFKGGTIQLYPNPITAFPYFQVMVD